MRNAANILETYMSSDLVIFHIVMENFLSSAQCAESGGQGDLGQIFIQIVNFQEDMAQNKTATTSGTPKTQITAFK